jgi:predicted enzyme related to lactoylglutathione lyase
MVKTPGNINGGFFPYDESQPGRNIPSFVIEVENLETAIEEVKKGGGKIIDQPQPIPGIGMWVVFTDTEDNRVSLHEPEKRKI